MANEQNLIPFNRMTVEEQRVIASKGGSVKSMKKKYAARIRRMRERGMKVQEVDEFLQLLTDSEASSIDILDTIKKLQEFGVENNRPNIILATLNQQQKWDENHHGSKKGPSIQINQQINNNTIVIRHMDALQRFSPP